MKELMEGQDTGMDTRNPCFNGSLGLTIILHSCVIHALPVISSLRPAYFIRHNNVVLLSHYFSNSYITNLSLFNMVKKEKKHIQHCRSKC